MNLAPLKKALQIVSAVPSSHILVQSHDGGAVVSSTNAYHSISVRIDLPLPTLVLFPEMKNFIAKLDTAEFELDTGLIVKYPKGRAEFRRLDPSLYNPMEGFIPEASFTINANVLNDCLKATTVAIEKETNRLILSGVWFLDYGVYASDGLFIVRKEASVPVHFCLPPHAQDVLKYAEGELKVEIGKCARFFNKTFDYTTALIDASEPPNFKQFTLDAIVEVEVDRAEFHGALQRMAAVYASASVLADGKTPTNTYVTLAFGDELTVSTYNVSETFPGTATPLTVRFDLLKLAQLVGYMEGAKMTLQCDRRAMRIVEPDHWIFLQGVIV